MFNNLLRLFIFFGFFGLFVEIFFTAVKKIVNNDRHKWELKGETYLWMFPIYGLIGFYYPIYNYFISINIFLVFRLLIGTFFIYLIEYISGYLLCKIIGNCPWDYSLDSYYNIHGLIRLDYFFYWFSFTFFIEQIFNCITIYLF